MNMENFNALVEQAYEAAFNYERQLTAVYVAAYTRQTEQAASRFGKITAAAWTPPIYESLTSGMNDREKEEADAIRDDAAYAILAILAAAGVAASSREFMEAISLRAQSNFEQEILRQLRKVVSESFDAGMSLAETAAAIRERIPQIIPSSAEMLAQTELTSLVNERSMAAAQKQFPDGVSKTWLTVGDNRVRAAHASAAGQTVPIDQPFQIGGSSLMYPGDPSGPLRLVARCFPPETLVAGSVDAVIRSPFEGRMVRVRTSAGHQLSGTENHPVLTLSGWKALGEIQEGDHLVRAGFDEGAVPGAFDVENMPTSIQEVFDTLLERGSSARIAPVDVDLYGDTLAGDVDVVRADSLLELPGTPSGFKPTEKFAFADSHPPETVFSSEGGVDLVLHRNLTSPSGRLRFERETRPLLVGHLAHSEIHGLGTTATLDPSLVETFLDGFPTDPEADGDFLLGQSLLDVEPDDFVKVEVDVSNTGSDVPFSQVVENRSVCDTKTTPEFGGRDTAFVVETDHVVSVESFASQGDVFTLSTEQGYYIANGFVARNCRCRLSYSDPTAVTAGGTASVQEDTMETMEPLTTSITWDNTVTGDWQWHLDVTPDPGVYFFPFPDSLTAGVTITVSEDGEVEEMPDEMPMPMEDGPAWRGLLAVEGVETEDGRLLAEGSLTWRALPLTLTAMDTSNHGAEGEAKVAGRIDRIWRDGNEVWGEGVFNTDEFGTHIYELVSNQSLRGNSIEPAVLAYEIRNRETGEVLEGEAVYEAMMNDVPLLTVFLEAVIMASTIVSTPAIADANIILASGLLRTSWSQEQNVEETLTASAAGMAPLHPPSGWFDDPRLDGPTPLTVDDEGRVFGHAALWNSCHIAEPNGPGVCVPPPRSGLSYECFHHGAVKTEEGHDVAVGQITMSTFHAGSDLGWKAAREHYEHTGAAVADVRAGEDRHGIWVSGALRPDLPATKVREMKAGSISGDWRSVIGRGLEFIGALIVNIGGFPVPRPSAHIVASASGEEEVLSLVAAGIVDPTGEVDGMSRREYLRKIRVLTS